MRDVSAGGILFVFPGLSRGTGLVKPPAETRIIIDYIAVAGSIMLYALLLNALTRGFSTAILFF